VLYSVRDADQYSRKLNLLGFFMMGIAVGLKLTSAIFAIGALASMVVVGVSFRQKIKEYAHRLIFMGIGIVVSGGYWSYYVWKLTGSPLFPFYNKIFKSEYYPNVNFVDERWLPDVAVDYLLVPLHMITKPE